MLCLTILRLFYWHLCPINRTFTSFVCVFIADIYRRFFITDYFVADFQTAYFIVYAAQFLRSAHAADFVAILVHILGVLDMVGALALYPAEALDIDHTL